MNKIKKKLQNIFKTFFYKIFILINGKVKGVINAEQDTRINLNNVIKENKISYKIFKVKEGRLYTSMYDCAQIYAETWGDLQDVEKLYKSWECYNHRIPNNRL